MIQFLKVKAIHSEMLQSKEVTRSLLQSSALIIQEFLFILYFLF